MPERLRQWIWELFDLRAFDPEMKGEFVWAGWLPPWLMAGLLLSLAAGAYLVMASYQRESPSTSARVRWALAGLRLLLLVLGLGFFLQPVWQVRQPPREETGLLIVLVDESLSMEVADEFAPDQRQMLAGVGGALAEARRQGRLRRIDVANGLLAPDGYDLLGRLAKRNHRLKLYAFGTGNREGVRELGLTAPADDNPRVASQPTTTAPDDAARGQLPSPTTPDSAAGDTPSGGLAKFSVPVLSAKAPLTEIGSAVQYVFDKHRHERLAGIVLISDGRNVSGRRPQDAARELAAAELGVPLFTIGIGRPDPPRNLTVEKIEADPSYFVRNPIAIRVRLRSQGLAGREVRLRMVFDNPLPVLRFVGGGGPPGRNAPSEYKEVVRTVTLVEGHQTVELPIFEIHRAGRFTGTVEVPVIEGEANPDDNSETFEFEVRPDIRVLLVAGATNWEFRYLREFYRRQELIDMSSWLQSAGGDYLHEASKLDKTLTALPSDVAALSDYDVVVLLDPDPRPGGGLSPEWFATLRELVTQQGTGLLMVAGAKFAPYLLSDPAFGNYQPLLDMLPVSGDGQTQRARANPENRFHFWKLTDKGVSHSVAGQLSQDPASLFGALPGFFWYLPTATAKAGAAVLAHPTGGSNAAEVADHVLWAEQPLGRGTVMWLAGDNTWLWRSRAEPVRRQFWLQMARYLSKGRTIKPGEKLRIETDRREYRAGETVLITGIGGPLTSGSDRANRDWQSGVDVRVEWGQGRQMVNLRPRPSPAKPGLGATVAPPTYEGFFNPASDGVYRITVPRESDPDRPRRVFRVETAGPELADRTADPATLREMARIARTGRLLPAEWDTGWSGLVLADRSGRPTIDTVERASPAAAAGLARGEIVTAVDLQTVSKLADIERALDRRSANDLVTLTVESGGLAREVSLRLAGEPNATEVANEGTDGLDRLVERAEPTKKRTPTRPKSRYLWDRSWLFAAFATLISLEWGLRKIYRMT